MKGSSSRYGNLTISLICIIIISTASDDTMAAAEADQQQ
jgi:hypothetical protein